MDQPSNRKRNRKKLQSAMEYLMTYGWALLVIMIILVALFRLGVFSAGNYGPRATPGSCRVSRPYGPYSTYFMKLQGVCSGTPPQYVARFPGSISYIQTTASLGVMNYQTVTAWLYVTSINSQGSGIGPNACQIYMPTSTSGNTFTAEFDPCSCGNYAVCSAYGVLNVPKNIWVFFAYTVNGANVMLYSFSSIGTSNALGTLPNSIYIPSVPFTIGSYNLNSIYENFQGSIANVQVYNSTLSANEIQAQYIRGIGGAPIKPENLVGWWPLNGDVKDYSGNGNDGVPTNVVYTSS